VNTGFKSGKFNKPTLDAGLGLVIRLNILLNQADMRAREGDYESYNFVLDRVYCNLMYRNPIEISYGNIDPTKPLTEETKAEATIEDVRLSSEDCKVFEYFNTKIREKKREIMTDMRAKKRSDYNKHREELYWIIMMKDMWLRKLMMHLGLYLKESSFDPTISMFGGGV
jgi:hypothetical protein